MSRVITCVTITALVLWGIVAPAWLIIALGSRGVRASLADETTAEFEYVVNTALAKDGDALDEAIDSIEEYYPSGTKQIPGSVFDRIVERSRRQSIELLRTAKKLKQHTTL